jgi:hypothetical protein
MASIKVSPDNSRGQPFPDDWAGISALAVSDHWLLGGSG